MPDAPMGCPHCGHSNYRERKLNGTGASPNDHKRYYCKYCGEGFEELVAVPDPRTRCGGKYYPSALESAETIEAVREALEREAGSS